MYIEYDNKTVLSAELVSADNSNVLFELLNKDIESLHKSAMRDIYPIFNNHNKYDITPIR